MAYRLEADERPAPGLKRIAREQLLDALALAESDALPDARRLRELRKRLRRYMALLRLARAGFRTEAVYREQLLAARALYQQLAAAHDRHQLLGRFDLLLPTLELDAAEALAALRQNLAARLATAADGELREPLVRGLTAANREVGGWVLALRRFDDIEPALRRAYRRSQQTLTGLRRRGDEPTWHALRHQVRVQACQLRLIRRIWPATLRLRERQLQQLAGLLGEAAELVILQGLIVEEQDAPGSPSARQLKPLHRQVDARVDALRSQALPLARLLHVERPRRYTSRLGGYWLINP